MQKSEWIFKLQIKFMCFILKMPRKQKHLYEILIEYEWRSLGD